MAHNRRGGMFFGKKGSFLTDAGAGGLMEIFHLWEMVGTCDSIAGGFRARDMVSSLSCGVG